MLPKWTKPSKLYLHRLWETKHKIRATTHKSRLDGPDSCKAKIIARVITDQKHSLYGFQPAVPPDVITISYMRTKLYRMGKSDLIPSSSVTSPSSYN